MSEPVFPKAEEKTPARPAPVVEVVWAKVRSQRDLAVIEGLKRVYGRRTRSERRAFAALCRKAARRGLLREVSPAGVEKLAQPDGVVL